MFPVKLTVTVIQLNYVQCLCFVRETRQAEKQGGQIVGLVSGPAVADQSVWVMTQSWLDNKLNHILLTADSTSSVSLLHSRNVSLSLLFVLLDVRNNLIFFCTQFSVLHRGQCIVLFPSSMLVLWLLFLARIQYCDALCRHLLLSLLYSL